MNKGRLVEMTFVNRPLNLFRSTASATVGRTGSSSTQKLTIWISLL
jgi:hypothetical protein